MAVKLLLLEDELDRQPTGRVFLSKSNPLAAGVCAGAVHTQILAPDVVTGELPVLFGGTNPPTTDYGTAGIGVKTASGDYSKVPSYRIPSITGEYTFICIASVPQIGAVRSLIDADAYPALRYMQFRVEASGIIGSIGFNAVDSVFIAYSSKSVTANIPFVAATRLSGNSLCVALSGEIGTPVAVTGSLKTTHPDFTIGGSQSSNGLDCVDGGATIYAWIAFPYGLPDARLIELTRSVKNFWQIFEPETIPLFKPVVTAQYASPVSDVSAGTWTASTGSDLFAMLDETSANDSDYITTTSASTCEVALGSLSDPALSTGHIVRYRISATGGGIIVRLREGATTIASWTHNPAPGSLTTYAQTLSGGEADSIINYAALKLQFEAIT